MSYELLLIPACTGTRTYTHYLLRTYAAIPTYRFFNHFSGFPDYILDPNELNRKYDGLEIKEDEYFLNNIRINQFRIKENLEKLDQPVNKSKLDITYFAKTEMAI